MNEVRIGGNLVFAPKEMIRLVDDPRAAELLVKLDPVDGHGENLVTVRCYGADADAALALEAGDWVEVSGQLVGQPAHVKASTLGFTYLG